MPLSDEFAILFRSLRHRNFRIFWTGQLVSLIGTWMQTTAQAWLVLDLTGSPLKLGIVTALQFIPLLFLSLFTGPLIDRFPKRRTIILTQTVLAVQALVLALLVLTKTVQYWHVAVLAAVLGIANTIDMPARQSFIMELVGREDLMNAVGLNSAIFNGARALGPALAGAAIAFIGTGACFLLNGLSFLPIIYGLSVMQVHGERTPLKAPQSLADEIREGLRSIRSSPLILTTILLVSSVSVFAANFNVLVPVFARLELHRDARDFGLLMSSFGAGALVAAASLTYLSRYGPSRSLLFGSGIGLGFFLVLIGTQHSFDLTALLLGCCGWCMVTFFGMANTTIQLNSEDHLRGRVMSIYTMAFGGLSPLGSMFAGTLAHWIGTHLAFATGGLITLACFATALFRARSEQ